MISDFMMESLPPTPIASPNLKPSANESKPAGLSLPVSAVGEENLQTSKNMVIPIGATPSEALLYLKSKKSEAEKWIDEYTLVLKTNKNLKIEKKDAKAHILPFYEQFIQMFGFKAVDSTGSNDPTAWLPVLFKSLGFGLVGFVCGGLTAYIQSSFLADIQG